MTAPLWDSISAEQSFRFSRMPGSEAVMVSGSMSHTSAPRLPSCSRLRREPLAPWERDVVLVPCLARGDPHHPQHRSRGTAPLTTQARAPCRIALRCAEPRGSSSRFPWAARE